MAELYVPARDSIAKAVADARTPLSLGDVAYQAALVEGEAMIDYKTISQAKVARILDELAEQGVVVKGSPGDFEYRRGAAKTVYGSPELRSSLRQAHFDMLEASARKAAEHAATQELVATYADEHAALVAKLYVAPDYEVGAPAAVEATEAEAVPETPAK